MTRVAPRRILLAGMFGDLNAGDEAICLAMVQGLRRVVGATEVSALTYDARRSARFTGLGPACFLEAQPFSHGFWVNLVPFAKRAMAAEVVVVGGGGLFQDQFAWQLPAGAAFLVCLGVALGKPTVSVGVGVGPIRRLWLRKLLERTLPRLQVLAVRDEESRREALELGVAADKIALTADVVLTLDLPSLVDGPRTPAAGTVAVALRDWPSLETPRVAAMLRSLADAGYRIRLLCFSPSLDGPLYARILDECPPEVRKACEIVAPPDLAQLLDAVRDAACFVSMRLHGCVFALALGTPLLPVLAERKIGSFARAVGLDGATVPAESVDSISARLIREITLASGETLSLPPELADRAHQNLRLIEGLVERGTRPVVPASERWSAAAQLIVLLLLAVMEEARRIVTYPARLFGRRREAHGEMTSRRGEAV